MPMTTSVERRLKGRHASIFTQVQHVRLYIRKRFSLMWEFSVGRQVPPTDDAHRRQAKSHDDQMIDEVLKSLVDRNLRRMVLGAIRDYDDGAEELMTEEDVTEFVAHLVGRRITLVGAATLEGLSMLLRTMELEHRYMSDELATRVARLFNKKPPLGGSVIATIEYGDVMLTLARRKAGGVNA